MTAKKQEFLGPIGGILAGKAVEKAIDRALSRAADSPKISLDKADVPATTAVVTQAVQEEVQSRIDHRLDLEPHYKSRNVWGAFVGIIGAADVIYRLWTDDQINTPSDYLGPIGVILGVLTPLYSRFIAKKPIGE